MSECEGICYQCGGCLGDPRRVHVEVPDRDWGYYVYCERAIAMDRARGLTVEYADEYLKRISVDGDEKSSWERQEQG